MRLLYLLNKYTSIKNLQFQMYKAHYVELNSVNFSCTDGTNFIPILMDVKIPHLDTKPKASSYLANYWKLQSQCVSMKQIHHWMLKTMSDLKWSSLIIPHSWAMITSWLHLNHEKSQSSKDIRWNREWGLSSLVKWNRLHRKYTQKIYTEKYTTLESVQACFITIPLAPMNSEREPPCKSSY